MLKYLILLGLSAVIIAADAEVIGFKEGDVVGLDLVDGFPEWKVHYTFNMKQGIGDSGRTVNISLKTEHGIIGPVMYWRIGKLGELIIGMAPNDLDQETWKLIKSEGGQLTVERNGKVFVFTKKAPNQAVKSSP